MNRSSSEMISSNQTRQKSAMDWRAWQRIGSWLLLIGVTYVLVYLIFNVFVPGIHPGAKIGTWVDPLMPAILWLHIYTAIPPLVIGLLTFDARSRKARPKVHIWLGTFYCVTIWISSVTGLILASGNQHGIWSKTGFGCLAVGWFSTTLLAYGRAREHDYVRHRVWMIRSYALTLAVVTVRSLFMMNPPGLSYLQWYALVTWLCWVPNLLLAEWYIAHTNFVGALRKRKPG